ncbi:hypothetical protein OS493_035140 [Desmophyllum pertusum]|uniref:Transmembrane protein n=1 Tax=Desmophyllum pertusum TaxID=174260 RepID=A0A9W9YYD6_9CNID|nr:hypothetical protein OS493_035140 [Desmophyllum pertusum]
MCVANTFQAASVKRLLAAGMSFSILRQQNIIGSDPEKIVNLLSIMRVLKPKRKDLVLKVQRHIEDNYEEPEMILKDFESSSDSSPLFSVISRSSTPIPTEDCCRMRCCGFACNYNPCCDGCCCCVILAILFCFLAIASTLAWYSSIPQITKYLKSNDDLNQAGPFVIGGLGFLAVCSGLCAIYIRYVKPRYELSYSVLPCSNQTSNQASYAASDSIRTSYSRRIERPRHCSCSSGQYTGSSSLASRASRASSRNPRLLYESDVVADGVPQDGYPGFFTQEAEDQGEGEVV